MSLKKVYINSISAFMPNEPVSNDDMESVLGQVGDRPSRARKVILRSNKITQRYYAINPETGKSNFSNAQLAAEAIKKLASDSRSIEDIDVMVCATTMADQLMPNHAVMVHGELHSNAGTEVVCTSGVCVCGVTALKYAYLAVKSNEHRNAVICASETSSASMRAERFLPEDIGKIETLEQHPEVAFEKDFLRWMLSDGAGACWLSATANTDSPSLKIDWIDIKSYANELSTCMYAGAIKNEDGSLTGWKELPQQGAEVSCMTVTQDVKQLNEYVLAYTLEKPLADIVLKRNLKTEDYDYFLPHFSSGYFEDRVAASLEKIGFNIPKKNWFTNLYTMGNTGSASIFIALEELFNSGRLKAGEKILCYVPESGRFSTAFIQLTVE